MNACQVRLGIRKIEEGGGVDLKVAEDGDVPDVARSLCVGDYCEYYWNEEYEWCRAKVRSLLLMQHRRLRSSLTPLADTTRSLVAGGRENRPVKR